jgi:ABC-type branched-subunit amino acid transport system substrate-binding protein
MTQTDDSAIRLGALVPATRPGFVEAGRHLRAGLELAVRDVNHAGGIAGSPLELVVRDGAGDPECATAAVDELAGLGVAVLAGEYHSVVARAAAARADVRGIPFLCSSAVLDMLTEQPTKWVARLAPAQSRGWQVYADFLLSAGHARIAVVSEPSVYWASGIGILRDYVAQRGGSVLELDMRVLDVAAVCGELVDSRASVLLLLVGYPEPATSLIAAVRGDKRLRGGEGRRPCSRKTRGDRVRLPHMALGRSPARVGRTRGWRTRDQAGGMCAGRGQSASTRRRRDSPDPGSHTSSSVPTLGGPKAP